MVNLTCTLSNTPGTMRLLPSYQFKKKKKVISIELFTSVFLMNFAEVLDTSVFMAKGTALPRLGAA